MKESNAKEGSGAEEEPDTQRTAQQQKRLAHCKERDRSAEGLDLRLLTLTGRGCRSAEVCWGSGQPPAPTIWLCEDTERSKIGSSMERERVEEAKIPTDKLTNVG